MIYRSYFIPVYSNPGKQESIRYTITRFAQYVQHFVNKFFYDQVSKSSTKGIGKLANQAQYKARGIIRAQRAASEATGNKSSCPEIKFKSCPAKIEVSEDSSYDYWISSLDQFTDKRNGRTFIPANSIKPLNKSLKHGWKLNETCELVFRGSKYPKLYARVFVEKEEPKLLQSRGFLGVDVGINHTVVRSDGYLGPSAKKILDRTREIRAERQRQNHKFKSQKTALKQQLDIDVNRALNVSKRNSLSLAVENPKVLANLKTHNKWAKCYFANRLTVRAREEGIDLKFINPAYSSITCSQCGTIDKWSRDRQDFHCTACGYVAHADLNAACILSQRASVSFPKERNPYSPI